MVPPKGGNCQVVAVHIGQCVADIILRRSVEKSRENVNRLKHGCGSKLRILSNGIRGTTAEPVTVKWSMCLLCSVMPTLFRGVQRKICVKIWIGYTWLPLEIAASVKLI